MASKKGKTTTKAASGGNVHKQRVARRKARRAKGSEPDVQEKHVLKTGPRNVPPNHIARRTRSSYSSHSAWN